LNSSYITHTLTLYVETGTEGPCQLFAPSIFNGYIAVMGWDYDYTFSSGPKVNDGVWHSIVLTYGIDGKLSLYIDHNFISSTNSVQSNICGNSRSPIQYSTAGDHNYLGGNAGRMSCFYAGQIRNIQFYNVELTATVATALYVTE